MRRPGRRSGFTLLEILCVVAIVGALVTFAVPSYQAARLEADKARCLEEVEVIRKSWTILLSGGEWDVTRPELGSNHVRFVGAGQVTRSAPTPLEPLLTGLARKTVQGDVAQLDARGRPIPILDPATGRPTGVVTTPAEAVTLLGPRDVRYVTFLQRNTSGVVGSGSGTNSATGTMIASRLGLPAVSEVIQLTSGAPGRPILRAVYAHMTTLEGAKAAYGESTRPDGSAPTCHLELYFVP